MIALILVGPADVHTHTTYRVVVVQEGVMSLISIVRQPVSDLAGQELPTQPIFVVTDPGMCARICLRVDRITLHSKTGLMAPRILIFVFMKYRWQYHRWSNSASPNGIASYSARWRSDGASIGHHHGNAAAARR